MPAPARTSTAAIVSAGRMILERDGLSGLTMQAVAGAVGVRAPSLYKRVRDRSALIRLLADDVADELAERLDAAATSGDPDRDLRAVLEEFRAFAHSHQAAYPLLFDPRPGGTSPEVRDRSSAVVLRVAEGLAGEREALAGARMIVAWGHGFVTMELAGAFQLGGDVEAAWAYGVDGLVRALGRDGRRSLSGSR
jgi:AcrR family transcriptional regulator